MPGYKWHPITDFESDPKTLTDGEMISLRKVWDDQRAEMIEQGTLDEFNKRLWREWSIETGIIERVYTLDRGVTQTLIAKGIDAALIPHASTDRDPALVARIIQDHYEALEGISDFVSGQRELSTSYVKELHAALLRNQNSHKVADQFGREFEKPLDRGAYKIDPNGPKRPDGSVHEFCPPEHVASEMDRLLEMFAGHQSPVEVEAAWLHHRFAQIHPFADGNGRVPRALASLVFIKAGWFPLVIKRDDWTRYIDALETADAGDLRPLVALFVEDQRTALIQASEIVYDIQPPDSVDAAIAAARDRLEQRGKLGPLKAAAAMRVMRELSALTYERLARVEKQLDQEIGTGTVFYPGSDGREVQLNLDNGGYKRLFVSFDRIAESGLMAAKVQLLTHPDQSRLVSREPFLINYKEDVATARERFVPWLERAIVDGLNAWRRTL